MVGLWRRADEPHEVELAEATYAVGCCGALNVTIRREGDVVIWDRWRNANGPDPDLPSFRFDAAAYAAEIEWATEDRSWERRARTVARLLSERLSTEPGALGSRQCEFDAAAAWTWQRERLLVTFWHPARPTGDRPHLQFKKSYPTTQQDPEVQAAELFADLTGSDPRARAELVGGSPDYARALGYPWPPEAVKGSRALAGSPSFSAAGGRDRSVRPRAGG